MNARTTSGNFAAVARRPHAPPPRSNRSKEWPINESVIGYIVILDSLRAADQLKVFYTPIVWKRTCELASGDPSLTIVATFPISVHGRNTQVEAELHRVLAETFQRVIRTLTLTPSDWFLAWPQERELLIDIVRDFCKKYAP